MYIVFFHISDSSVQPNPVDFSITLPTHHTNLLASDRGLVVCTLKAGTWTDAMNRFEPTMAEKFHFSRTGALNRQTGWCLSVSPPVLIGPSPPTNPCVCVYDLLPDGLHLVAQARKNVLSRAARWIRGSLVAVGCNALPCDGAVLCHVDGQRTGSLRAQPTYSTPFDSVSPNHELKNIFFDESPRKIAHVFTYPCPLATSRLASDMSFRVRDKAG